MWDGEVEVVMLRNIGLLLLIVIGSQLLIFVVMQVTGLQYQVASYISFAVMLMSLVGVLIWLSFRVMQSRAKFSDAMSRSRESMQKIRAQIPELREAVENIRDSQKRAEALADLEYLEKGSNRER